MLVCELQSVSKAARHLDRAPSAISRRLKELEERLNTQLLTRTTRSLTLTNAGEAFLARGKQILADLDEAESRASSASSQLSGNLRVSAPLSFGLAHLMPATNRFLSEHSELRMDLDLDDRKIDLIGSRFDLAIRIGELQDSTLKSRKLATVRLVVAGSPTFWEAHGVPDTPDDLHQYLALCYSNLDRPGRWDWVDSDGVRGHVSLAPRFMSSSGDALVQAATGGLGILRQPTFIVNQSILNGDLTPVLLDFDWGVIGIHALYPDTRFLPRRTRSYIDYLVDIFAGEPPWDACLRKRQNRKRKPAER